MVTKTFFSNILFFLNRPLIVNSKYVNEFTLSCQTPSSTINFSINLLQWSPLAVELWSISRFIFFLITNCFWAWNTFTDIRWTECTNTTQCLLISIPAASVASGIIRVTNTFILFQQVDTDWFWIHILFTLHCSSDENKKWWYFV